jgi:hypothetical protein
VECWRPACITIGVRILPSATTATLAAQSSAQTALTGDSFAVVLSAASEEAVSAQPAGGSAAKEQSAQGSAGRGTGRQAEAQAAPAQSNANSRTSAARRSDDRTESQVDETSGDEKSINPQLGQRSSVVTGRNWSPTLIVTSLQSPAASIAASAANSTPLIAALTTWTASTLSAPIAGVPQQHIPGDKLTGSTAQTRTDEQVVSRKNGGQSSFQVRPFRENGTSAGSAAIPQAIPISALDAQIVTQQENGQSSEGGSFAVSARTATVETVIALRDLPQSSATQATSDAGMPDAASAKTASVLAATASLDVQQLPATQSRSNVTTPETASTRTASVPAATVPNDLPRSAVARSTSDAATPEAASAKATNFQAVTASHEMPQSAPAPSTLNAAAPEREQSSQGPRTPAMPADSTIDSGTSAPAAPNGVPGTGSAAVEFAAATMLQQSIALPVPAIPLLNPAVLSSKGSGIGAANNTTQMTDSNAVKPTNYAPASAANAGTSKAKDDASGPADAPNHNPQNAQSDPSQSAATTPKVQDIAATHPQVQTVASPTVTHEAAIAPRGPDVSASASHLGTTREAAPAAIDPEGVEAAPTSSGVSAAKLVQAMSESEMHIGLSSNSFGDISIRTSVTNHQMLAQISLDHSELSQAISAHVSSVQAKLSDDYGLRASIQVNNFPSSHSGEPGNSSPKERNAAAAALSGGSVAAQEEERIGMGQEAFASAGNGTRLDIRA